MKHSLFVKLFSLFLVLTISLGPVAGCGKKAGPRPPHQRPPAAVSLASSTEGDVLTLTWDIADNLMNFGEEAAGFMVYRSKISLSDADCPTCPPKFERVADIQTVRDSSGEYLKDNWRYRETLATGYQYTYKVTPYTETGTLGGDSNSVKLIH